MQFDKEFEGLNKHKAVMGNQESCLITDKQIIRYTTHTHCGAKEEGASTSMLCKTKKQAIDMYLRHVAGMVCFSSGRVIVWRKLPILDRMTKKDAEICGFKEYGWKVISRFALATEEEIKRSNLDDKTTE